MALKAFTWLEVQQNNRRIYINKLHFDIKMQCSHWSYIYYTKSMYLKLTRFNRLTSEMEKESLYQLQLIEVNKFYWYKTYTNAIDSWLHSTMSF